VIGDPRRREDNGRRRVREAAAATIRSVGAGEPASPGRKPGLEETLRWLEKAVETMQLGVTITDTSGTIVYTNPAEAQMHGYTVEELLGRDARILSPAENWKPMTPEQLREARKWQRERVRLRKDGTSFPVQLLSDVVRGADGEPLGIVTTCEDISDRKRAEQALRESEHRYRSLVEAALDVIHTVAADGTITSLNPAFERLTGWPASEWIGRPLGDLLDPEDVPKTKAALRKILRGDTPEALELRIRTRSGEARAIEAVATPQIRDGRVMGALGIARDVTERRRADEALRESEERYALAAKGANDGLWDLDLRSGVMYYSPRWKSMLGYAEDDEIQASASEWWTRVHPEDEPRVREKFKAHIDGRTTHFEDEHRMRHKDGTYRWFLCRGFAARDASGTAVRIAGAQTDVTDRRSYDPLTGLPNRALFTERLEEAVARCRRVPGSRCAVLFIDLDRFKIVNDSLGHLAGDQLLVAAAQRLEASVRPMDVVGRFGGDEFSVLLDGIKDIGDATRVANRIQNELRSPLQIDGQEVFCSASIGIAMTSGPDDPQSLLRDADTAMYRAKALGKGRYEVVNDEMRRKVMTQLQLESDLRRGMEAGEFAVHYQPIVSVAGGRVLGAEALLRWRHPSGELLRPAAFLAMAEETGLIVPIGYHVLREACVQARGWQQRQSKDLSISVNLSPRQLAQSDFIDRVREILHETGFDARSLRFEIRESVLMEDPKTSEVLSRLKSLGVRLDVDDFGTGYSSLGCLHRFPIDSLKIDSSFVSHMDRSSEHAAIVRTILSLARTLSLDVVAEGVETNRQLARLRALRCNRAQGHCFAEAMEAPAIESLLPHALPRAVPQLGRVSAPRRVRGGGYRRVARV
jgi:diguanylate cyclase (GGDEF)-like protein/PAS domain S-box-containing protein